MTTNGGGWDDGCDGQWQTVVDDGSQWRPTVTINNSRRQVMATAMVVGSKRWWTVAADSGGLRQRTMVDDGGERLTRSMEKELIVVK